jgi:hypothetical protein
MHNNSFFQAVKQTNGKWLFTTSRPIYTDVLFTESVDYKMGVFDTVRNSKARCNDSKLEHKQLLKPRNLRPLLQSGLFGVQSAGNQEKDEKAKDW